MAEVEISQATAEEARRRADRIKVALEGTWQLIQEAYFSRDWSALGYSSWDEYCISEYGNLRLRLPREELQETVVSLRDAGLSLRAIAAATQQSKSQVQRELSGVPDSRGNGTPDIRQVINGDSPSPGSAGLDGRVVRPSRA